MVSHVSLGHPGALGFGLPSFGGQGKLWESPQDVLERAIAQSRSPSDVLDAVGSGEMPNAANMVAAIHRIACADGLESSGSEHEYSPSQRRLHTFRQLEGSIATRLLHSPEEFTNQELSDLAWGIATLKIKSEPLLQLLQREVVARHEDMTPQQMVLALWACHQWGARADAAPRRELDETGASTKFKAHSPTAEGASHRALASCGGKHVRRYGGCFGGLVLR